MNRKELVEAVVKTKALSHLSKKDVEGVITTTIDAIKKTVKSGDDVSLIGFGTFTKMKRKARAGANPSTGEKIQIKAKNVAKFRPGKAFAELLNPTKKK